jgi:sn-glycerol 3-phosphate transport system ATP-binding protein
MVAGLEEITERRRSRSARASSTDVEPAERDIAMVFQNYALYPHMSVYDNMAYGLKIAQSAASTRSGRGWTRRRDPRARPLL